MAAATWLQTSPLENGCFMKTTNRTKLSASHLLRTRSVSAPYLVRSFSPPIEAEKKRTGYEGEEK